MRDLTPASNRHRLIVGACLLLIALALLVFIRPGSKASSNSLPVHPTPDGTSSEPGIEAGSVSRERAHLSTRTETSTPAIDSLHGSLRVTVMWGPDRIPAVDIGARIFLRDRTWDFLGWREARTGSNGSFLVEEIPPGDVIVLLDRGYEESTHVEAGEHRELVVELPAGIDVEGEVIDDQLRPVSGASIRLSSSLARWTGSTVTHSDRAGSFRIRQAPVYCYISAFAPGYAPSLAPHLTGSPGAPMRISLLLPGPGGSVEGLVRTSDGEPVAGALVLVGEGNDNRGVQMIEGRVYAPSGGQLTRTGEDGRFRVESVASGETTVSIRAPSFEPCATVIQVPRGAPATCDLVLSPSATVFGHVRDDRGAPVADARIEIQDESWFRRVYTRSAADGSYLLSDVPTRQLSVSARSESGMSVEKEISLGPGERLSWNPVLSTGLMIRGLLEGPSEIVQRLSLIAVIEPERPGEPMLGPLRPTGNGSFVFNNCLDRPHELRVIADNSSSIVTTVRGVRPGPETLVVPIGPDRLPTVMARGRVLDSELRPVLHAEALLTLEGTRTRVIARVDNKTGEFVRHHMLPGTWTARISAPGHVAIDVPPRDLFPGETWEMGDRQLLGGGSLVAVFRREDDSPIGDLQLGLVGEGGNNIGSLGIEGRVARSGTLGPGTYWLRVLGDRSGSTAPQMVGFDIQSESKTRLEVTLLRGVSIRIVIRTTPGQHVPRSVAAGLTNARGQRLFGAMADPESPGTFVWSIRLASGVYHVQADADNGLKASGQITVTGGASGDQEVELLLGPK